MCAQSLGQDKTHSGREVDRLNAPAVECHYCLELVTVFNLLKTTYGRIWLIYDLNKLSNEIMVCQPRDVGGRGGGRTTRNTDTSTAINEMPFQFLTWKSYHKSKEPPHTASKISERLILLNH